MISDFFLKIYDFLKCIVLGWILLPWTIITYLLLIRAPNWRYPPGPLANWLPFIGSLPLFIIGPSYQMLARIASRYGKIYRLKMGSTNMVVISDHALLRETFSKDVVSGRSIPPVMDVMNRQGIIHAEGPLLQSQRAFINRVIPNLTTSEHFMHNNFVNNATTAIRAFLREMEETEGKPTCVEEPLSFLIINMFYATVVSNVFPRDNKELATIINSTHEHFRKTSVISFTSFIPIVSKLPLQQDNREATLESKRAFADCMLPIVEKHKRELNREHPKDLIDAFLVEGERTNSADNLFFNEPQLYAILGDIFATSLETISAAIHWLLLALLKNPEHQELIYEEFDRVVGTPETGCLVDKRPQLPYLEATIMEALRFSSILPIGVTHRALDDTLIDGYKVPKGSIVAGLFWTIHRDPKLWKNNPKKFNPTNHLNDNGAFNQSPNLLPFSTGQRSCLGDQVAFEVMALIVSNLLCKFIIQAEDVKKLPSLNAVRFGLLREPLPFKIKFVRR